jgi:ferric-dicitrate binding protein FerR (iron transport regulator)
VTGPEHYREAEDLLALAGEQTMAAAAGDPTSGDPREPERNIAAAQVHATLALAAGMALQAVGNYPVSAPYATAWSDATGLKPPTGATS